MPETTDAGRGLANVQLVAARTWTCTLHCLCVVNVQLVAPDGSTCTFAAPLGIQEP
jgi:hypothetical protein